MKQPLTVFILGLAIGVLVAHLLKGKSDDVSTSKREVTASHLPSPIESHVISASEEQRALESQDNRMEWPSPSLPLELIRDQLTALGCPVMYIQDIIIAERNRQFADALAKTITRYCNTNVLYLSELRKFADQHDQLRGPRLSDLQRILGAEASSADEAIGSPYQRYEMRFLGLSEHARGVIASLEAKFKSTQDQIRRDSHGFLTIADREALRAAKIELEAELQRMLSPVELARFKAGEFAHSDSAHSEYESFDPSLSEISNILDYTQSIAQIPNGPAHDDLHEAADNRLKEQLGKDRFEQFMNNKDADYREAMALSSRFGLPSETANKLMMLRRYVDMNALVRGGAGDIAGPANEDTKRGFAIPARAKLVELLGPDVAKTYLESGQADWLRRHF